MFSQSYDPFGFNPYCSFEQQRRQEIARRQCLLEAERRRRAELEWRKRNEEKMAMKERRRREKELLELQRQKEEERRRRGRRLAGERRNNGRDENSLPYPPGTIVLGPDGRLYTVTAPKENRRGGHTSRTSSVSDLSELDHLGVENEEERGIGQECAPSPQDTQSVSSNLVDDTRDALDAMEEKMQLQKDAEDLLKADEVSESLPIHMIAVEDVPDEEDEELRELHSVWRNRIPSLGQWIEPVDSFDN